MLARTLFCVAMLPLAGQDPDPAVELAKKRLRAAMTATGLSFEASPSGLSLKVPFENDGGRHQTVYASLAPNQVQGMVVHSIYTTVWVDAKNPPDEALMRKLFGQTKKVGAFYLFQDSKGAWAIRFGVQFDATDLKDGVKAEDAAVKALGDLVQFVNQVGEAADRLANGEKDVK